MVCYYVPPLSRPSPEALRTLHRNNIKAIDFTQQHAQQTCIHTHTVPYSLCLVVSLYTHYIHAYIHTYIQHIHTYTHTYKHTHIHTYIHTYIYIYTHSSRYVPSILRSPTLGGGAGRFGTDIGVRRRCYKRLRGKGSRMVQETTRTGSLTQFAVQRDAHMQGLRVKCNKI